MHRGIPSRLARLLSLCVLGLGVAGCVPGTAWLPDSSGIIYTGGKKYTQLIHYDLKKGEQKVLVADTKAPTIWPAVSPDGKRLAVAHVHGEGKDKPITLQVALYDRAGKELRRSRAFPLVDKVKDAAPDDELLPQLFWAPRGERVVVHIQGHSAIYDAKEDRFINLGEALVLAFGGTPFRPDGAGFLVMKNVNGWMNSKKGAAPEDPRMTFVDLDGKGQPIKAPPLLLDAKALDKEKDINKLVGLLCPVLFESGWDGDTASVRWNVDRLRYFTKKGEAIIDSVKPEYSGDYVVQHQYRLAGGARVRVVNLGAVKGKDPMSDADVRVELLRPGKEQAEVLVERANGCVVVPSPNGKLVALRCVFKGKKKEDERVLIVNDRGEVSANLHVPR
ncbi:MAG: hypothetical protein L0Z62_03775 [Gemmataceae bacterium]|nr:hypothetical protein [Gemmataceae bacterium]